jgi:hypothetical protein
MICHASRNPSFDNSDCGHGKIIGTSGERNRKRQPAMRFSLMAPKRSPQGAFCADSYCFCLPRCYLFAARRLTASIKAPRGAGDVGGFAVQSAMQTRCQAVEVRHVVKVSYRVEGKAFPRSGPSPVGR